MSETATPVIRPTKLETLLEKLEVEQFEHASAATEEDNAVGALCKAKVLYEGPDKCRCCINWVEERPVDVKEQAEDLEETRRHAIVVRMRKNHGEGKPLILDSIVIHSEFLKKFIEDLFKDYLSIIGLSKRLVIRPSADAFYYEWDKFNKMCEALTGSEWDQARLLHEVLSTEVEDIISSSKELAAKQEITYDLLWTIFKPGIDVACTQEGHDYICRLNSRRFVYTWGSEHFKLILDYVDCDGNRYGWATTTVQIPRFEGTKPLSELKATPIELMPDCTALREKAIARGKLFRDYTAPKYHYAAYKGTAKLAYGKQTKIDGRIVIDTPAYQQAGTGNIIVLKDIDTTVPQQIVDFGETIHIVSPASSRSPSPVRRRRRVRSISPDEILLDGDVRKPLIESEERPKLDDKFLQYCSPHVKGYCLKTKKWVTLAVDSVKAIRWNEKAFNSLVMAPNLKRMIRSFVESQVAHKDTFDDIIEGKGRGIIMLLEGSPGVGKTLTAEAIADELHRPLYSISGGEVGYSAEDLEVSLESVLDLGSRWDAIVLLDECDVFLEKRSYNNLKRNSVVSVLLKLFEYYEGILFLTTNRVETIDPAFQSRIHLTVQYPKLGFDARAQVWKQFFEAVGPDCEVTSDSVMELAQMELNGREIKNLVKTAQLLARHENMPVRMEHVQTVADVMAQRNVIESADATGVVEYAAED